MNIYIFCSNFQESLIIVKNITTLGATVDFFGFLMFFLLYLQFIISHTILGQMKYFKDLLELFFRL